MPISRRQLMMLAAGTPFLPGLTRMVAASLPEPSAPRPTAANGPMFSDPPQPDGVDRLAAAAQAGAVTAHERRYRVSATVTLLGIPLVTKSGVGSGYALVEEGMGAQGRIVAVRFAAGSLPESARGLNRVGYIEEMVLERPEGAPSRCAYFGFMTTSQEKNLDQAKKALEASGGETPYSAACGAGGMGRFVSRVTRISQPSKLTWRDLGELVRSLRAWRADADREAITSRQEFDDGRLAPSTFLYAVRKAIARDESEASELIVYNGKQYILKTTREADPGMGANFAGRNLARADRVMRLNGSLRECRTGQHSPFTVWFESGAACAPPLRFEYQARSFLRLVFEADSTASGPPIASFFNHKEENA